MMMGAHAVCFGKYRLIKYVRTDLMVRLCQHQRFSKRSGGDVVAQLISDDVCSARVTMVCLAFSSVEV